MDRIKNYLLKVLIIFMIMYLFAGCGQKTNIIEESTKKIKIGVCIASFSDKYGSYMLDEMKNYSKSLNNVEVTYADAKLDSNTQLSQVENFISQRVDVLVVDPVYTDSTKAITDKAKAANIPIIAFMLPFKNQDDTVSFVAPDSKQAGALEMEYLAKKMNFKGNVAVIMGPIQDRAQTLRTEAYHEIIAKYPDMKIVAEQTADWDRARSMAIMEKWLQSGREIDGVVCNNDEMAIGAIKGIEAAGKLGKIAVGGIDATPDGLDYLRSGKLAVTVFQDASKLAQLAIETAVKAAMGEHIEKEKYVQTQLVTQEDADKYMAKWKK